MPKATFNDNTAIGKEEPLHPMLVPYDLAVKTYTNFVKNDKRDFINHLNEWIQKLQHTMQALWMITTCTNNYTKSMSHGSSHT